jgi:thiol-disulfide isomerase/thioredoxin
MKLPIAFIALMVSVSALQSQSIKKLSIAQLDNYIQHCDHPLIVNFWATYCEPCVAEIPYFSQEVSKHKKIELLLVSLDLPDYYPVKIESFAKKKNFPQNIVWLNETDADYFCPKIDKNWSGAIPASYFVNNKTKYKKFYESKLSPTELSTDCKELIRE